MKRITITAIILIAAVLAYAGGPRYLGQVRVDMRLAGHSRDKVDSVMALPLLPTGKYLYVNEDYSSAAVVTIHENGSGTAEKLYPLEKKEGK